MATAEQARLEEDRQRIKHWRKWGPYLSERQWGTVREDYSPDGSAWDYFPHDHARSRAYRWGEDGIGGSSDNHQHLCVSVAMWNGRDPILKERLFGLTGPEGNHGEDVKELYYYLDGTPTHSYLKMLYKYPQRAFPYDQLVQENRKRSRQEGEYELLDTGIFNDDRYFDVFIEYAKGDHRDILMQVTVFNRGPERATIHLIPQVWFRNTWSWSAETIRPEISPDGPHRLMIAHSQHRVYRLTYEDGGKPIFTENDTNSARLYGVGDPRGKKDAFHDYVVHGNADVLNEAPAGTKAGLLYKFDIPAGGSERVRLRLFDRPAGEAAKANGKSGAADKSFDDFDAVFARCRDEADEFYKDIQRDIADPDIRLVQRQAFAGMIWSKQFYHIDIRQWLNGDPTTPKPPESRRQGRNADWQHLNTEDILSMPDKWEYPWFAAWDLAFHCIPLAMIDAEFAKNQLVSLTREWYMHPNGQLPAYEWQFGDVNPPVHAWATWRVFRIDAARTGKRDHAFLERVFHKLLLNFTWWVNRKDAEGRNIFQGGFLGLDNIGVFDRSAPLPTGGFISQADGTSWMAMYSLNLMRIALELARQNPIYQDIASKFFEHFLYIAAAMTNIGGDGIDLWDQEDEFFYDVLCLPDKCHVPLKVRSMVGLIPLFAVEVLSDDLLKHVPEFTERLQWFLSYRPELAGLVSRWHERGKGESHLLSLLRGHRMKCLLKRALDESEFLSDYGVRALSRYHKDHPYVFDNNGADVHVTYTPGESDSEIFGGNSNWRGPIWMPLNFLLIESLRRFHGYYGADFLVEYPTGSGAMLSINEIADELTRRLGRLVLKDANGRRAVFGDCEKQQTDPHFRDYVPFYEYFHGDTGRGVGASHQTGWTGLLAHLLASMKTARVGPAPAAPSSAAASAVPGK